MLGKDASCVGGVVVISGIPPECSGTMLTVPVDVGNAIDVTGIAEIGLF